MTSFNGPARLPYRSREAMGNRTLYLGNRLTFVLSWRPT